MTDEAMRRRLTTGLKVRFFSVTIATKKGRALSEEMNNEGYTTLTILADVEAAS
jgi:hypothetical protein